MKKAFRIIAALMLVAMLATMFVGCNDTPATTAPNTKGPDSTETGIDDDFPKSLEGFEKRDGEEIGIVMCGGELATRSITLPEEGDETYSVNLAVAKRNAKVEEVLGVKIDPKETVGMQSMVSHMREYFSSPDTSYDIVGVYQYFDMGLAFGEDAGSFYNYNDLEEDENYLTPEADYWDTEAYELLQYEDAAFWITGDLSQTWLSTIFVSYVNAEMWNTELKDKIYALPSLSGFTGDIYDLVYAGKWTIDLWCELNEIAYENRDGNEGIITPEDRHGFIGYNSESNINNIIVDAMFSGCHVTFSKIEDGVPKMNYNNNSLKAYADATRKLWNESKSCTVVYSTDKTAMDIFADGISLMTVNTLAEAELSLADMSADYYILPPPKANEAQSDYATTVGDSTNQFGIPKGCEDIGAATATLEALGYYSKKYVTPEYYDNALKGRYTRGDSDKAAEMIDFTRSKVYSDFVLMWTGSMTDSVSWYLRKNIGTAVVKAEAASKQNTWGKQLNTLLGKLEDTAVIE